VSRLRSPAESMPLDPSALEAVLGQIAAGASAAEAGEGAAPFPEGAITALERVGALRWNAHAGARPPAGEELDLVRRVARADGSVGRIFDGHLNAVERLAVQAPAAVRERELAAVRAGKLRAGVWGGDPRPGEGPPAAVLADRRGELLRGVKTFCSGAGGLDRALVLARSPDGGAPLAVWVQVRESRHVEIDTGWYRSHGLRASASHRVCFHDAPVLARFGGPGALSVDPWFSRDALRTAASWVGMLDCALQAALAELRARPQTGELEGLLAARMLTAHRTAELWLAEGARAMDCRALPAVGLAALPAVGLAALPAVAVAARAAIAEAAVVLLDCAARACGSHPFATGSALDRARRDLEVFLLQHRLDPLLARWGRRELEGPGRRELEGPGR
jgi:hypothetical protein